MLSMLAHFIAYKEIAKKFSGKNIEMQANLQEQVKTLQTKLNKTMPYLQVGIKSPKGIPSGDNKLTPNQKAVKRAKEYIDNNLDKNLSLKDISTVAALSPTYFSYVFKKQTKTNIENYIINAKIEKAKQLLKQTMDSIGEVAYNIGYNDANYFSFIFKKITGISPRDYRKIQ
jgi:two-component system response regulator YesN